ncbi:hypothetical protein PR048_007498, partial [Dryococelus australis]
MPHYRLHQLRAKMFFEIIKTEETNIIRISFDMEQNQPLPKLRVSEVFSSRQIWLYNLTLVSMEKNQNTSNTSVYTWIEDQSGRGSNEVTSALSHFVENAEKRLFTDACSGKNKDTNMMMVLLNYVHKYRTFKHVEHYFPIRGHSYMPPDRIFGQFEQELRKKDTIIEPNDYHNVFVTGAT